MIQPSDANNIQMIDKVTSASNVTVTASDEVGEINSFKYKLEDAEDWILVQNTVFNVSVVGKYVVEVEDKAGNKTSDNFEIVAKPSIITTPTVADQAVVRADDGISVDAKGTEVTLKVNGTAATELPVAVKNAEGVDRSSYNISVVDKFGSSAQLNFTIDNTKAAAPKLELTPAADKLTNESVKVTASIDEMEEGVEYKLYYKFSDTDEEKEYPADGIIVEDNNTSVYVWYTIKKDAQAPVSSAVAVAKVENIDKTLPEISVYSAEQGIKVKSSGDTYTTSANAVTINATDDNFDTIRYSKDGADYKSTAGNVSATLNEVGSYKVEALDRAGNTAKINVNIVAKPTISTTPAVADGQVVSKNVLVTSNAKISVTKDGENVEIGEDNIYTTTTVSGSEKYVVTATDEYGSSTSLTFTVDRDAPVAPTFTVVPEGYTNLANEGDVVTVTINYPEDAVNKTYKVEYNDGTIDEQTLGSEESVTPIELTQNAKITAYYTTGEGANEKTSATGIKVIDTIDKIAPAIAHKSNQNGVTILPVAEEEDSFITSASSVALTISDEGTSGIESVKYTLDGGNEMEASKDVITLTNRGTYVVTATDKAGNTKTQTYKLVAPAKVVTTPEIIDGQVTTKDVTITVVGDLVAEEGFTVTRNDEVQATENNTYNAVSTAEEGSVRFSASAKDKYGATSSISFSIDKSIPDEPTITALNTSVTNKDVKVQISYPMNAKDKKYKIEYANGTNEEASYTDTLTITKDATITAWYTTVVDESSETPEIKTSATAKKVIDYIDKVSPELSVATGQAGIDIDEQTAEGAATTYTTSASSVSVKATDAKSGIDKTEYTFDSNSYTSQTPASTLISDRGEYTFTTYDKAGNTAQIKVVLVDAPNVTVTNADDNTLVANNAITNKDVKVEYTPKEDVSVLVTKDSVKTEYSDVISGVENEAHDYTVTVTDKYKNSVTTSFTIDTTIPNAPKLVLNPTDYTKDAVKVTVGEFDSEYTDIKVYAKLGENAAEKMISANESGAYEVEVSDNDTTVYAWYKGTKDNIVKTSAQATINVNNIDKDAPVITLNPVNASIKNDTTSAQSVNVVVSDALSGIKTATVTKNDEGVFGRFSP